MKRVILVLALLLVATPAFAAVTITATQPDPEAGDVVIAYTSDEANEVRGLALDITVVEAGKGEPTITAVTPATVGETVDAGTKGFGIFPSTITIDEDGDVTDDGVPVSPYSMTNDANTQGGIGTAGVTLEMATLYDMDDIATLAPGTSGTLATITVDHDCDLTITANNIRGGIVLNDGTYSQDPCETTALAVSLPSGVEVRFEEEPGCACPGDVSGGTAGVPDGVISLPDITYIVGQLTQFGGKTRTIPMSDVAHYNLCADVSGSTAGEPDNAMSLPDITYIVGRLTAAGGKTRTIPCSTGLYP